MTTLTDKMEKLFQDEHPVDCIDGVTPVETYGYEETYNGAVRDCIALVKAIQLKKVKYIINTLFDVKNREIAEAYKKGFIDGGVN